MYSAAEYAEMLILYGECGRSAREAARQYAIRFPQRLPHPNYNVFLRLVSRARDTGSLMPTREEIGGPPREARTPETEDAVLQGFDDNGQISIRTVANMVNTSKSTVQRILRDNRRHAYHYTRVQNLIPEDHEARVNFCTWLLQQHDADPNFVNNILFTDESLFSREGTFNCHNYHIWAEENPHAKHVGRFQHRFTINLWAGILGDSIVGPFEFPARLNAQHYMNFLEQDLPELLEDVPLQHFLNEWFQHDGAPVHFSRQVRQILDRRYQNSWIGRGGPVNWPARSPDLTPLDYFLWGHLKNYIYREPVNNLEELNDRIHEALAAVTPNMIRLARENLIKRARLCLDMEGGHFEHLL
jgi:hypothetical protein